MDRLSVCGDSESLREPQARIERDGPRDVVAEQYDLRRTKHGHGVTLAAVQHRERVGATLSVMILRSSAVTPEDGKGWFAGPWDSAVPVVTARLAFTTDVQLDGASGSAVVLKISLD